MKKRITYLMMFVAVVLAGLPSCSNELAEAPIIMPEGGIGTGTWDNPMTAYQCRIGSVNPAKNPAWVTGYIVGVVNTNIGNTISERSAQFEGPFETNTNLLLAMRPDVWENAEDPNKAWEECTSVQLPSGAVRTALNLVDNPENLGKQVTIKGETGIKYCGVYGLKSCSDFNWGDKGNEEAELKPVEGPTYWNFEESTSFDLYERQGWKNVMVRGGLSGWYIKKFNDTNYITVSAYNGTATGGPYENWLITPALDMSLFSTKTIEFVSQAAYVADNSTLEVYVLDSNDPKKATKTRLDAAIAAPPTGGGTYSSWVDSGKIDLSAYTGVIYIGWRYYSEKGGQDGSTTYCLDNINVGNASAPSGPAGPDSPDVPSGDTLYTALVDGPGDWTVPEGAWRWDAQYACLKASSGKTDTESIAYSPAVSLKDVSKAYAEFEHAAKFQTTCRELCRLTVREKGTSEWTEFEIPAWPTPGNWNFAASGKIDISAFAGKEVEIGLKYGASTAGADTWEVKKLQISGTK